MATSVLFEVIQMNVAIVVSCIPFSRLLITSVSSGLMTTNLRNHAPNFDGTAEFNMSNIGGQRFSQGAFRTPNSRMSRSSRLSRGLGSISFPEDRMSKSWELPWKNVKHTTKISNYSLGEPNGRVSPNHSPSDSEQNIIRTTTEWAVDRNSISEIRLG